MTKSDFETATTLLKDKFGEIASANYNDKSFGSWFVELKANPRLRLLWDGKEGQLNVQRISKELFNGFPVWDNLWIEAAPKDIRATLLAAMVQLQHLKSGAV